MAGNFIKMLDGHYAYPDGTLVPEQLQHALSAAGVDTPASPSAHNHANLFQSPQGSDMHQGEFLYNNPPPVHLPAELGNGSGYPFAYEEHHLSQASAMDEDVQRQITEASDAATHAAGVAELAREQARAAKEDARIARLSAASAEAEMRKMNAQLALMVEQLTDLRAHFEHKELDSDEATDAPEIAEIKRQRDELAAKAALEEAKRQVQREKTNARRRQRKAELRAFKATTLEAPTAQNSPASDDITIVSSNLPLPARKSRSAPSARSALSSSTCSNSSMTAASSSTSMAGSDMDFLSAELALFERQQQLYDQVKADTKRSTDERTKQRQLARQASAAKQLVSSQTPPVAVPLPSCSAAHDARPLDEDLFTGLGLFNMLPIELMTGIVRFFTHTDYKKWRLVCRNASSWRFLCHEPELPASSFIMRKLRVNFAEQRALQPEALDFVAKMQDLQELNLELDGTPAKYWPTVSPLITTLAANRGDELFVNVYAPDTGFNAPGKYPFNFGLAAVPNLRFYSLTNTGPIGTLFDLNSVQRFECAGGVPVPAGGIMNAPDSLAIGSCLFPQLQCYAGNVPLSSMVASQFKRADDGVYYRLTPEEADSVASSSSKSRKRGANRMTTSSSADTPTSADCNNDESTE